MKTIKLFLATLILFSIQTIIAQDGKEMIGQIYEYEEIEEYDDDNDDDNPLARVKYKGKYGFINKSKKVVIPIIYENAYDFFRNSYDFKAVTGVKYEGKYGAIDKDNKIIVPFLYDEQTMAIGAGMVIVYKKNKFGFCDFTGKLIIDIKYEACIYGFGEQEGFRKDEVIVKYKRKWGVINTKGKIIRKFKYVDVWDIPDILK
jgi:hypothetical protein